MVWFSRLRRKRFWRYVPPISADPMPQGFWDDIHTDSPKPLGRIVVCEDCAAKLPENVRKTWFRSRIRNEWRDCDSCSAKHAPPNEDVKFF